MPLTTNETYSLAKDLNTIARWADCLPIDTSLRPTSDIAGLDAGGVNAGPCDLEAIQHSKEITIGEAVIASTTEYWLADQDEFQLPPELQDATNVELETTIARCRILAHNIHILANHPNIQQIDHDILRCCTAIEWARDNDARLHEPDDTAQPPQPLTSRRREIHIANGFSADTTPGPICPHCQLTLPISGPCDCGYTGRHAHQ